MPQSVQNILKYLQGGDEGLLPGDHTTNALKPSLKTTIAGLNAGPDPLYMYYTGGKREVTEVDAK